MIPISKCIKAVSKAGNGRERQWSRIVCLGLLLLSRSLLVGCVFFPFYCRTSILPLKP